MILKRKYLIAVLLLACYPLVFAQFNTLTRKEIKSTENITEKQFSKNEPPTKKEKGKRNIVGKLFNNPTKMDLKNEIDSLKTLILQYSLSMTKEQKLNPKIKNDSLIQMTGRQIISTTAREENLLKNSISLMKRILNLK